MQGWSTTPQALSLTRRLFLTWAPSSHSLQNILIPHLSPAAVLCFHAFAQHSGARAGREGQAQRGMLTLGVKQCGLGSPSLPSLLHQPPLSPQAPSPMPPVPGSLSLRAQPEPAVFPLCHVALTQHFVTTCPLLALSFLSVSPSASPLVSF